jgi:hypothetical protein
MRFWANTWSNVLGGMGAGLFFALCYLVIQWFLRATDLVVSYCWKFSVKDGVPAYWPAFDIRNRSRSRNYRLANIAYTINGKPHWFDNKAIMNIVLEPASMNFVEGAPVRDIHQMADALRLEVTIRDQAERSFWLRAQGPGQQGKSWIKRTAFKLRRALGKGLISME